MSDHRWLEDVPAYALGALDDEERERFEAHLADCDMCRDALRGHEGVVETLSLSTPSVAPPAELRARVLDAAAGRDAPSGARPGAGGWLPWMAAAAAVAFAVWTGVSYRRAAAAEERLRAEIAEARAVIQALQSEGARRDSMLAALTAPGLETATLASTEREPRVRLFWNRERNLLLLTAFDLPPAPAGRTYQLWGIAPEGDPVSLGTFDTGVDRIAVTVIRTAGLQPFEASAVTEEPAGGSPQPTTQPFLVGPWSASGP